MLTTTCKCGTRYDHEEGEVGSVIKCACGREVRLLRREASKAKSDQGAKQAEAPSKLEEAADYAWMTHPYATPKARVEHIATVSDSRGAWVVTPENKPKAVEQLIPHTLRSAAPPKWQLFAITFAAMNAILLLILAFVLIEGGGTASAPTPGYDYREVYFNNVRTTIRTDRVTGEEQVYSPEQGWHSASPTTSRSVGSGR